MTPAAVSSASVMAPFSLSFASVAQKDAQIQLMLDLESPAGV